MLEFFIHAFYLVGAALFVMGLKRMSRVRTARRGNQLASLGMLLAVIATAISFTSINWTWILLGLVVGSSIGAVLAKRIEMTSMPELVALFNGLGGIASVCVALSRFLAQRLEGTWPEDSTLASQLTGTTSIATVLTILVGCITFTGSIVAFLKLSGKMKGAPIILPKRHVITIGCFVLLGLFGALACFVTTGTFGTASLMILVTLIALGLGVLVVIPIGGADMPVVISLLNSYSGVAASMTGFILLGPSREAMNPGALMLIICGALVGAAGLILTSLMCKAMNRSLLNVLAGGFGDTGGSGGSSGGDHEYNNVTSYSAEEAALLLDGATQVVIVPGYGLAVAQAQHAIQELDELLESRGTTVKYGIHPVAGRMPGHMNVLLAEANVPYEKLVDLDDINSDFKNTQVSIIVGANDVVNPAAIKDPESPIAGMPILNCHESQNVIMIKRSLSPGYAGIKNELFEYPNTMMIFDDAKVAVQGITKEVKDL